MFDVRALGQKLLARLFPVALVVSVRAAARDPDEVRPQGDFILGRLRQFRVRAVAAASGSWRCAPRRGAFLPGSRALPWRGGDERVGWGGRGSLAGRLHSRCVRHLHRRDAELVVAALAHVFLAAALLADLAVGEREHVRRAVQALPRDRGDRGGLSAHAADVSAERVEFDDVVAAGGGREGLDASSFELATNDTGALGSEHRSLRFRVKRHWRGTARRRCRQDKLPVDLLRSRREVNSRRSVPLEADFNAAMERAARIATSGTRAVSLAAQLFESELADDVVPELVPFFRGHRRGQLLQGSEAGWVCMGGDQDGGDAGILVQKFLHPVQRVESSPTQVSELKVGDGELLGRLNGMPPLR